MEYIYFCPRCKATLGSTSLDGLICGSCGTPTVFTGMDENDWYALPRNEREARKKEILEGKDPKKLAEQRKAEMEAEAARQAEEEKLLAQKRKTFLSTTTHSFEGYRIVEYIKIESGQIVLGTGLLSELSASFRDSFGKESKRFSKKFEEAKTAALERLADNCILAGANAVVGVDLDITTIGENMVVACANGTAVRIERL